MSAALTARLCRTMDSSGIPYIKADVYGSQVVITCSSKDAAERAAYLLRQSTFTVKRILETKDYNQINHGTCLLPTMHTVYKVFATV